MNGGDENFWAHLPLGPGVELLARDANGLAALNKPAGVLSHPNRKGEESHSLLRASYAMDGEYFEWRQDGGRGGGTMRLWLLNRLDSATSGVILVAANAGLASEIRVQFRLKQVRKIYHALVFGKPAQAEELWRDSIEVRKQGGRIRTAAGRGRVPASCLMRLVRAGAGQPRISLLQLEPRTGRSHQLRVQCAKRGLPIVGDQTYGRFPANREFARITGVKRMFLHSSATSFEYDFQGRMHAFTAGAPPPPEFGRYL